MHTTYRIETRWATGGIAIAALLALALGTAGPLLGATRPANGPSVAGTSPQPARPALSGSTVSEAEHAMMLVLQAPETDLIGAQNAEVGLTLATDFHPLALADVVDGHAIYGAPGQSSTYLGEQDGRRVYFVTLAFDGDQGSTRSVVVSLVDVASDIVNGVFQLTLSGTAEEGHGTVLHPTAGLLDYAFEDGEVATVTRTLDVLDCLAGSWGCPIIAAAACALLCGAIAVADPAGGALCSIVCGVATAVWCSQYGCCPTGTPPPTFTPRPTLTPRPTYTPGPTCAPA